MLKQSMVRQIVFIDGLGGRRYMRGRLIRHFEKLGYSVRCFDYSTSKPLQEIKIQLEAVLNDVAAKGAYHAIGYSFGGVLLRMILQGANASIPSPKRIVLLASPLTPMRLASILKNWRIYKALTGECGQLVANPDAMAGIPLPLAPTACIYGVWPWLGALGLFAGFELPHDGMVAADEALSGKFQLVAPVSASHAFIPAHPAALAAAGGWFGAALPAASA
jgi:hypothetical protein